MFVTIVCDNSQDKVHHYVLHVLNLGLLWHSFNDAIRGDSDRITNIFCLYASVITIINLYLQYHFFFQAQQLKWSRVVNNKEDQERIYLVTCILNI